MKKHGRGNKGTYGSRDLSKIVMMTGDSERTTKAIAKRVGVDEYYAEVLPEDKAEFVIKKKQPGVKLL